MTFDAVQLQSWYESDQGRSVVQRIGQVMERWVRQIPSSQSCGIGFTQPYLDQLSPWLGRMVGAAPAEMGVSPWPQGKANRIAQIRPDALPFPDQFFTRVIMVHLLEGVASGRETLRETWRILEPGGRLLLVVPNRGGLWARRDCTPFGWGRPFSPDQIANALEDTFFVLRQSRFALFQPPFKNDRWLGSSSSWEKAGNRWFAPLGGVILCEAEKVVCAPSSLRSELSRASQTAAKPVTVTERTADHPPHKEKP